MPKKDRHVAMGAWKGSFPPKKIVLWPQICSPKKVVAWYVPVLQQLMPDRPSSNYSLRARPHNKTLIARPTQLNDQDFIIRSIYKDSYWLYFKHIHHHSNRALYLYYCPSCEQFYLFLLLYNVRGWYIKENGGGDRKRACQSSLMVSCIQDWWS